MAKKTVTIKKDGYKTVWHNNNLGDVDVDVYQGDKLILEWSYPKIVGKKLESNASFWLDQAILEAKQQQEKKDGQ